MALTLYTFFRCRKSATDVLIKLILLCLYRCSIEFTPPSTCQDDCCVGTVNSSSGGLKKFSSKRAAPPGRIWRLVLPTRLSNSRRSFPSLFFSVLTNKQNVRAKNPDTINIPPFSGVGFKECACWRIYPAPALLNRLKSNQQKGRMFSFCGYHFRFAPLRNLFVFAWTTLFVRRLFLWLQPKWSASRKQVRQRRKL